MIDNTEHIKTKILSATFLIFLIAAIVFVAKATLTALGVYSSMTYSVVYFSLFGAGFIFTKYVFFAMFRTYQYVALAISAAISGLCYLGLIYLH